MVIPGGGFHFKYAISKLEYRDIESSSPQVKHQHRLVLILLI